ncbi:MAG: D-glycero-beta-D-manno-heptose 1-phosphate adenylyltransferase [Patescibacteria group bacterium]|nr:D-glycero-beta-D-manno-heptose 1-phosphate adenylyltransferase [Patescibacteria group bacterium]
MRTQKKIKALVEITRIAKNARAKKKKVVTTNGCFDILHIGHIRNLSFAKSKGDILIVGVNSDASVRALKGKLRPIVPARERAEMIAALHTVDYVFIFRETTPFKWLEILKPDIHIKGGDRRIEEITERNLVIAQGGKVVLCPVTQGRSTSKIITRILDYYGRESHKPLA